MDSGIQTMTLEDVKRSLHEINFTVSGQNVTSFKIALVDAYTKNTSEDWLLLKNESTNFVTISNLTSGSLFTVDISSTNETLVQNISTKPEAVKKVSAVNISYTSAVIKWDKYESSQEKVEAQYQISGNFSQLKENSTFQENYKILSHLVPNTTYQVNVSVVLYNLSSANTNTTFTTYAVLPPHDINIFAVNTTALNITWAINKIINPEYVQINTNSGNFSCQYKNRFCVIQFGKNPGQNHTLNIFSVQETYASKKVQRIHPTKPEPPNLTEVSSNSTSITVQCWKNESDFDYYLIYNISKRIARNETNPVTVTFSKLKPQTRYNFVVATISGSEKSNNFSIMFATNPSLDQVNISVAENSVSVTLNSLFFDNCTMCLYNNNNSSCKLITNNDVKFDNVRAGMKYFLNVSCYEKWSNPREVIIPPFPPASINVSAGINSANISWQFNHSKSEVEYWFISVGRQIVKIPGNNTSFKIGNLSSGTDYNVTIWSFAASKNSSKKIRSIKTFPTCITTLNKVSFTNNSITLNLSETKNSFDRYKFFLEDQFGNRSEKYFSKNSTTVDFLDLEAGVEYEITLLTVRGTLESEPCNSKITARTKPNAPVVDCQPDDQNIHVKLMKGQGYIDGFQVSCNSCVNFTTHNLTSKGNTSLNISQLTPNEMYEITVRAVAGGLMSENVTCNSTTKESAPSEVEDLKAEEIGINVWNLTWTKPKIQNGHIRWYIVECTGIEVGTDKHYSEVFNSSNEFYELTVKPGYSYSIIVKAFTVAPGPATTTHFTSKTYAPEFKSDLNEEMKRPNKSNQIDQHSLTVEFPTNPFTEKNGRIINYTVLVATTNKKELNQSSVLPNWYQFNKNPSINAYQVISNCTNLYQVNNTCNKKTTTSRMKRSTDMKSVKFKIGVDDCSKENSSYCNGYLKPGTNYYVKVRAYTHDAFQDTPFSMAIQTESEKTTLPTLAIALAVICPLVTLFFMALAFYIVRKRSLPKTAKVDKDTGNYLMPRYKPTSRPVNLINFRDHVIRMSSDSDFQFAEEYEDLKDVGKSQEWITAQLMCNRNKNRFANILPYDHSRVKLSSVDDEEGSDYINANYLPGFHSRREYIVTQGPLCSTRDDFWRMISEQNVHNIVMLTRCVEKLREKCDQYWPESGDPVFYGDVQVAKMHETITPDWTVTEFKITLGEKSWNVRHFHFTSWPDFGVPNSPQVLVNFVQTVRKSLIKTGPIVVHCSAGVGRSGTFIAVDHCMQHIQINDYVDVLGVVHEMRMHRVLMVQTEQQYIYIHQCLLNALESNESEDIYQNVVVNQNGGHDNQAFLDDDEGIHVA